MYLGSLKSPTLKNVTYNHFSCLQRLKFLIDLRGITRNDIIIKFVQLFHSSNNTVFENIWNL